MPGRAASGPPRRYRFGSFVLAPASRQLLVGDDEVRLIPRYFDLLVLLVECRDRAVHRQEIFDRVWVDVIVSDGALSQAIRTLRRTLGDDPREPRFIRTVSRHGYQFVHPGVREDIDDANRETPGRLKAAPTVESPGRPEAVPTMESPDRLKAAPTVESTGRLEAAPTTDATTFPTLVDRLLETGGRVTDEERRDAAEQLHALGTAAAIQALSGREGAAEALAMLRDARWDVPGAGPVPLLGQDAGPAAIAALVRLRLRHAARLASRRWAAASAGGALAGVVAGVLGGIALLAVPQSRAPRSVVIALALVGAVAGALGAAGVGAGLAAAEALARSHRAAGLVACGGAGGALAGLLGHALSVAVLGSMFGQDGRALGGGLEGQVLGLSAGAGYAIGTTRLPGGGMATPHGGSRVAAALLTGACCAAAGIGLALMGRHLVAASLDILAGRFEGSSVGLAPLARAFGEGELRPLTRTVVSGIEGLLFGSGVALGLTRRPKVRD